MTAAAKVLVAVANRRGLKSARLLHDRSKYREYVEARWELWHLLVHELGMGYAQVGRWHGYNHATVIWGVRKHAQRISRNAGTVGLDSRKEHAQAVSPSRDAMPGQGVNPGPISNEEVA